MPLDTVSGHTVWVMDRGGHRRLHQITDLNEVKWGRVRDDISMASVKIAATYASEQAKELNEIEPGRHEICVYRGDVRVWEGPVTRLAYTAKGVEVFAADICWYLSRTAMHAAYSSAYPNTETAINRMQRVLTGELARKEALAPAYNILSHITTHETVNDARTSRVTEPYATTVFEHMDDMAAKGGLDYTVIGRALHLWDVDEALGETPQVTESDFLGDMVVTVYGAELATRVISTDGQGGFGIAGGIDPYYGEIELLTQAYDEEKDESLPTSAELQSQANRNIQGRNPTPLTVRVPENSSLNPEGILTVDHLVPGVHIPLLANLSIRRISQMLKLNSVTFTETADKEEITISLGPAAQDTEAA